MSCSSLQLRSSVEIHLLQFIRIKKVEAEGRGGGWRRDRQAWGVRMAAANTTAQTHLEPLALMPTSATCLIYLLPCFCPWTPPSLRIFALTLTPTSHLVNTCQLTSACEPPSIVPRV